jgi:hypothetical protein
MFVKYILIFLLFSLTSLLLAQETEVISRINYLSKENVYIDKGENAGLRVGDTLIVEKNGQQDAFLIIIHTSQHSASCKILEHRFELQVGDQAKLVYREEKMTGTSILAVEPEKTPDIPTRTRSGSKPWARIGGGLSVQWYHLEDLSGHQLDFDQPALRFNLKAKEIWGKNYNFIIRTRLRKDKRSRSFSTGIARETFRNRIYTFYFSYDDPTSAFNYAIGRIQSNQLSGVGYLDGLFLRYNLSPRLHIGVYGGLKSSWEFAGAEGSRQKYGLMVGYRSDRSAASRIETSLAVNTEYKGKTVSRENLYFQSSFSFNNKLFVYNSVEVDINRSWRKERTSEAVSLSSFYLSARYRFSDVVLAGLSFDDRKNYYTYDTMEIPEDYYDMAARYSLGAELNLYFPRNYTTSFRAGIRKRQNDTQTTYTGRASFRKSNLFIKRLSVGINLNLYSNYYTEGWIPTVFITKSFSSGHYLSITGGQNSYRFLSLEQDRRNFWMRLNSQFSLWSGLYLSGYYNYNWGDDRQGYNFLIEIGYRF